MCHWLLFCLLTIVFLPSLSEAKQALGSPWQHPLYLDNGGYWKQRIPCTVQNNTPFNLQGDPFSFRVGKGKDKLPLAGALAESIRVTNATGDQLLYRVTNSEGIQLERGPIASGAKVTIPLENKAGEESTYFFYFDNAAAWAVGEYFYTHREVGNGGFETPGKYGLLDWELEWPEEDRDINQSTTEAHSGSYSLELSSETTDNERNYGAIQENIHLIPGVTYQVEAWFKSKELNGTAGLVLNPKNLKRTEKNIKLPSIHLEAAADKDGWSRSTLEFTAPEEANALEIRTYIEGTGTLWVDDVKLSCKADYRVSANIMPVEKVQVKERGKTDRWVREPEDWPIRASITVPNFTDIFLKDHPLYVEIQQLKHRLHKEIDNDTVLQITDGTQTIPFLLMENAVLFKQDIPASTVRTFYLYFSESENAASIEKPDTYTSLSQITENLIVNAGFDDHEISGWERFGETGSRSISPDKEANNSLVQISFSDMEEGDLISDIEVSHSDTKAAVGLSQTFEVEPGSSYFFGARVKCSNILDRTYTLRVRFLNEDGEFTGNEESLQANPDMYQNYEWVSETMMVQTPTEFRSVKVELLNSTKGEVWYDDVFFMKIGTGSTGAMALERKASEYVRELETWQENPIVKVFPDDLPNNRTDKLILSAARNEVEPLQLVMRSPTEYKQLEVRVPALSDIYGNQLNGIEVGIVGYVPVNYPSNFYRDFETPFWRTKMPVGTIGSDGWSGWFPDPILPVQTLNLSANKTETAWIEISVPEDAPPGVYKGNVSLICMGKLLKEIPLEMQVYDFALPKESTVATFDLRFNNHEMFGRTTTEQQKNEEIWNFMKEHRIGSETIRPEPEFNLKDGEVVVDFSEFDKAGAHYFEELKFQSTYAPWQFYLFGWGHPPKEFLGEKPYLGEPPYHGTDRSKLRPEYVKLYQSALRQYWEHMKEKGWADKVIMYISDEPHADQEMELQTKAVCDMIHAVDPNIPIYISTWWYRPEFEGYVDIWGVSHRGGGWGHPVPVEHLEEIKKNGGEVIFTTDGMVCTDTPYIGFERLIPYFCFKYGAREYENWAANWHTLDPYHYGWHTFHRQYPSEEVKYWMRYPNGAGNMIYPGPPIGVDHLVAATRLKQAREGVEDYEYMTLLKRLIERRRSDEKDIAQGKKALDRALDLVTIPSADGRYTTGYVSDPNAILEIRHEMAEAIVALSN